MQIARRLNGPSVKSSAEQDQGMCKSNQQHSSCCLTMRIIQVVGLEGRTSVGLSNVFSLLRRSLTVFLVPTSIEHSSVLVRLPAHGFRFGRFGNIHPSQRPVQGKCLPYSRTHSYTAQRRGISYPSRQLRKTVVRCSDIIK